MIHLVTHSSTQNSSTKKAVIGEYLPPSKLSSRQLSNTPKTHMQDWHFPNGLPKQPSSTFAMEPDDEYEAETDTLVADPELFEPPMYAVIMYNDDYTPMDFVVMVLMDEFRHDEQKAVSIMLDIHNQGQGIAGVFAKDIAETKANKVNNMARKAGYPLLTDIEPNS